MVNCSGHIETYCSSITFSVGEWECPQQVDELEAAVKTAKLADHSIEVQAAESRIRSLQGSLSRKDDAIREMKERTEQAVRYREPKQINC